MTDIADAPFDYARYRLLLSAERERVNLSWEGVVFDPTKHPRLRGKFTRSFSAGNTHILKSTIPGSTEITYHVKRASDGTHSVEQHVRSGSGGRARVSHLGSGLTGEQVVDKLVGSDSVGTVEQLAENFRKMHGRDPTPEQIEKLRRSHPSSKSTHAPNQGGSAYFVHAGGSLDSYNGLNHHQIAAEQLADPENGEEGATVEHTPYRSVVKLGDGQTEVHFQPTSHIGTARVTVKGPAYGVKSDTVSGSTEDVAQRASDMLYE